MLDKPKNKEIVELHYQHKEDKLRQRIRLEKQQQEALAKEMEVNRKEAKENEIFRLADESFPPSECSCDNEIVATSSNALRKFDYQANQVELSSRSRQQYVELVESSTNAQPKDDIDAINEIPCGQKIGKRVILKGFHDRIHSEPRGKSNLHRVDMTTTNGSRTYKDWLQTITNDPKIVVSFSSRE